MTDHPSFKPLPHWTFGMGDRFGREGTAQLDAILAARREGIDVHPVWNKSHREHTIVGSAPQSLREEADAAVAAAGFDAPYFVDADHINLGTVDAFAASADFFTLDVADGVGETPAPDKAAAFLEANARYLGELPAGEGEPITLAREELEGAAAKFLAAIGKAGAIYRRILERKGGAPFAVEISIDETDAAQTPGELFCILSMIASEGIPAQTVAPKFTGRFNKGVDYAGDLARFEKEFDEDLRVIGCAIAEFGLPENLKLSVHSGSDKFSLYPIINRLVRQRGAGLHVKTAGTTWLEEVIGLAEAGGDALELAREIYRDAFARRESLVAPYRTVVDIDPAKLPDPSDVALWEGELLASALRHEPGNASFNPDMRQLVHVGFKVAAGMGGRFTDALDRHRARIAANVTHNLLARHLIPLFGPGGRTPA